VRSPATPFCLVAILCLLVGAPDELGAADSSHSDDSADAAMLRQLDAAEIQRAAALAGQQPCCL
jgi:hypothetical protein